MRTARTRARKTSPSPRKRPAYRSCAFRPSAWTVSTAVIAPKDRAAGISAAVSKVASGAAESVPYYMVTNLARTLDELKERDIWIVGADERAEKTIYESELPAAIAWVLGAEGEGMRRLTRERCDLLVRIPMRGSVESLNVSVASGVCLFESRRRRA